MKGPEWFAQNPFGYGAGLPISWQGGALTAGFLAISWAVSVLFRDRTAITLAIMIPVGTAFLVTVAKTTRGGWRWRWGNED